MKPRIQPIQLWPTPSHLEDRTTDPGGTLEVLLEQGDTIQGVLVDLTTLGIDRLRSTLGRKETFRGCLVITLSPACPTRMEDLRKLLKLQDEFQGEKFHLQLRLLPLPSGATSNASYSVMPPSYLLVRNSQSRQCWLWHGTNGDLDLHSPYHTASFNLVLPVGPLEADIWQRQFDYVSAKAAPLNVSSITIPHLIPALGEIEAAHLWSDYCKKLYNSDDPDLTDKIHIDPETGRMTAETLDGKPVETASSTCNVKTLSPELREILPFFELGSLVSVDETTRIKPLTIPVKSFLFRQKSADQFGTVKRKQSFSLALLDEETAKEIERYRKINDTISLYSFSLGLGSHWIPLAAKPLLEKQLDEMESAAKNSLGDLISKGSETWVEEKWMLYLQDLRSMYQQIHGFAGEPEPSQLLEVKITAVKRLNNAIQGRLVPKVSYGSFTPEISDSGESVSSLSKVLHLLKSSALTLRMPWTNSFFERNFSKRSIVLNEWLDAMNVFGDTAPERFPKLDATAAQQELSEIETLCDDTNLSENTKLERLWKIIHQPIEHTQSSHFYNETPP